MDPTNPWLLLALIGVVVVYHLELLADFLNLSRLRLGAPAAAAEPDAKEKHERMVEYNTASTKADILRRTVSLAILIGFWFLGGFGWLDAWARSFGWGEAATGVLIIAALGLAQNLLALPFDIADTFGIEARFGFNRTTVGTFIADRVKGLVLAAVLGLPIVWLIVWFFSTQKLAAVYAWASVALFSLVMAWAAPRFIMPLFLKFQPLAAGSLREAILALAARLHFPVGEVSVVDGSRRSTKANAFFAGFGRNKRIALFDTLLGGHSEDEILAVLAHEIGHFKKRHVIQQMVVGLAQMAVLFGLLHFALQSPSLFAAFGVREMSAGLGLVLFMIAWQPLSTLLETAQLALSRKHEFEADAFASAAMGRPTPLATALEKLSADHLAHPAPHPFYVRLHYSHPPMRERLQALG